MKSLMIMMVAVVCVAPFLVCGCKSMDSNKSAQFEKGTRIEDVLQTCKDAGIIRPPDGEYVGGQPNWFLVRTGTDKYCMIDERGLVAGTVEKKYEISEKCGTEGARYSVVDEKMLKEYVELTHCEYVGRNVADVIKAQGRLIYASGYDVSWISLEIPTLNDRAQNAKRIFEIERYFDGVSVAEFLIAIDDELWLVLRTDSNGTIVESSVQDDLPRHWAD